MQRKKYFYIIALFLGLNILAWQEVFILAGPEYLKVKFFNVGQGDSAFIETPQGHQILIDGGPDSSVLEKMSKEMPFWDREIDAVILTHPEKDHMAGILDVLQRYKVDYFLWTGVKKQDAENKKLDGLLAKTKSVNVYAGEKIKAGAAEIDVLFPLENLAGKEEKNSSNDGGVVLKLTFGRKSFLFTGDISEKSEKALQTPGVCNLLADVLKVAHHGSKTSTSQNFLAAVMPEYAVISVGKNTYGHPTKEVLERLSSLGIETLRTDQNGDITMITDGNKIYLKK